MHLAFSAPRYLLLALMLVLAGGTSQDDDVVARVAAGLESADPSAVLVDAPDRVEVVLFGEGGMFRRAQAIHVLRDFFRRYPPQQVSFSEPSSSDDGQTAIGRYSSSVGGPPLNVRVLHRRDGDDLELASIRIDQRSAARPNGR